MLADGLVSDEILRPGPILSLPVEELRIWVAFGDEPDRPWALLERAAFVLGQVAKRLASAAAVDPYGGEVPEDACFSLRSRLTLCI